LLERDRISTLKDLGRDCEMLNDMVVDAAGRAYVNAYFSQSDRGHHQGGSRRHEQNRRQQIESAERDGNSHDSRRLIANDMGANLILSYVIASDGALANRQVFANPGISSPDGLCLDAVDGAWIGFPFDHCFRRIERGGNVTAEIHRPPRWGVAPSSGARIVAHRSCARPCGLRTGMPRRMASRSA
jgi:sugar lactone lactonase YvrE